MGCGKNFPTQGMVNMHVRKVHEKDPNRPRPCKLCKEEFTSKHELNNHVLIVHEGIKPIMCPQCPMGFARNINLTNHIRYVHCEATYPCEKCDMKFKTKGSLTQHTLGVHTDGLPFQCSYCEKSFP